MNIHIHKSYTNIHRNKHTYGYAYHYLFIDRVHTWQVRRLVHVGDICSGSESHRLVPKSLLWFIREGVI